MSANRAIEAWIVEGMDEAHLTKYETGWKPDLLELRRQRTVLQESGIQDVPDVEDAHWDWRSKLRSHRDDDRCVTFVMVAEDDLQGIMMVAFPRTGRIPPPSELVYIEYLHVAPWNRSWPSRQPRFKGVGSILVRFAIKLSQSFGFKGRIALHALPRAITWYGERLKMTCFGADSAYFDLDYFEYNSSQANAFLSGMI